MNARLALVLSYSRVATSQASVGRGMTGPPGTIGWEGLLRSGSSERQGAVAILSSARSRTHSILSQGVKRSGRSASLRSRSPGAIQRQAPISDVLITGVSSGR